MPGPEYASRIFRPRRLRPLAVWACVLLMVGGARGGVVERNLGVADILDVAAVDSVLALEQGAPVGERIGRWARRYRDSGRTEYLFGLADGGYAAEGLLAPGLRQDCVSFLYRVTELARAGSARQAVELALAVRFAGADPDSVVGPDGRVDYDRPEHLDFSLDMIRSGHWGRDVTAELTGARPDSVGSSRYPAGSFVTVPEQELVAGELREGDVVWLVLDPADDKARAMRERYGLVIGHAGVVIVENGERVLVHAASSPLPGWYERGGVVSAPLPVYLQRVERYGAVMVTRLED
jgi:hypothetical protein